MTDQENGAALMEALKEADPRAYIEDVGEDTVVDGSFNLADVAKRFLSKIKQRAS